jgi:ribonuclease PH
VVLVEKYPKGVIDVDVNVIDGKNSRAGVLTAVGLALMGSGLEIRDVLIGATVNSELQINAAANLDNSPAMTVGYLPRTERMVYLTHAGATEPQQILSMTDVAIQACIEQHKFIHANLTAGQ